MVQITVAIPAYKPQFLSQAIASVLAQTFTDYELLISDDCPDGAVRAVVERFADPRIRLIEGPRAGLVPNSVRLWEAASADFLKFVYDDDFLLPFALAELSGALAADPTLTYAFCRRHVVDATGRIVSSPLGFNGDQHRRFEAPALAQHMIGAMQNPIGEPVNVLIRRSAFSGASCLNSYGGFPVRHMIDMGLYLNAAHIGPCVGVAGFHAAFRRHDGQVSSRRKAPGFSIGWMEWELFIRAAVSQGLVPPGIAIGGLTRLDQAYGIYEADFPELSRFRAGLPDLRGALERGDRDLLTDGFQSRWRAADSAIAARVDTPAG